MHKITVNKITFNRMTLASALLAALAMVGLEANTAQAQSSFGLSIGGPNVRLNVGSYNPYYYSASRQVAYSRPYAYSRGYDYDARRDYRRYDTRRYDYVPARAVTRGDYCPSRYDRRGYDPRFDSRRRR